MKASVLTVIFCLALASASAEKKPADPDFLQKQQKILQLFVNLNQQDYNTEQAEIGKSFNPADHAGDYTNTRAVKEFIIQQKEGFIRPYETFSRAIRVHMQQGVKLFEILYFAKDFDTFYKTACFLRRNVNEFLFDFILRVVVVYRPDTKGIRLPPISESNPFLFVKAKPSNKHRHTNNEPGFNPDLQQRNGQAFPVRSQNLELSNANIYYLAKLHDLDRRIRDAVDSQLLLAADGSKVPMTPENGIELLGKAMAANIKSTNREFYSGDRGQTSYLQLFAKTVGSIADPYQIYGISFQETTVKSVEVGELDTYFDNKDIDLCGALNYQAGEQAENFNYKARQTILNYKPFVYTINVDSTKDFQAVVRVFIGPKYTTTGHQHSFDQARHNFVEFDRFVVDCKCFKLLTDY